MALATTVHDLVDIHRMAHPYHTSSSKTYTVSTLAAYGSHALAGADQVEVDHVFFRPSSPPLRPCECYVEPS